MEKPTEEDGCCCCSCCSWCLSGRPGKKKYAGIKYELVIPKPGQHRSFHHQQQPNPAVILPPDVPRLLPSDYHYLHTQQPPYIVTQQPRGLNPPSDSGHPYSPHQRLLERSNRTPSPTSSLSEDSSTPALTKLRSVARSPKLDERSDTIDISQSPTGTFSSAYHHSQKRRSYGGAGTITTTRSSSDETELDTSSSSRGKRSSKSGESFASELDSLPTLQMSFYYHIESECLSISLHSAQNLPPKQHKSYLLTLHPVPEKGEKLETKITSDHLSLAQTFEISEIPRDNVRQYSLVVRLHDGSSSGELLGSASVALEKTDLFGMICTVFLDTNINKPKGELLMSLSFDTKTSVLQGILLKLTNTTISSDRSGLPDIYVKIYLVYKGKRSKQWKSSVKLSITNLIFNEAFQFDLRQREVDHTSLEVCILSYDRFSKDIELGKVFIGSEVEHVTGRQHWRQIIAQPLARISHWHTFTPGGST